jgi:hypothetical protein
MFDLPEKKHGLLPLGVLAKKQVGLAMLATSEAVTHQEG